MTRQSRKNKLSSNPSRALERDDDFQTTPLTQVASHDLTNGRGQVIKRSMHKLNAPSDGRPRTDLRIPTPAEFETFSSESLILAQDERWRHA